MKNIPALREEFENTFAGIENPYEKQAILDFFIKDREDVLKEVRDKVESMLIKHPVCDCKTHPEHNCGFTSNEAIEDVLSVLTPKPLTDR